MSDGYTVFGAGGFVGHALVLHLRSRGETVRAVGRGAQAPIEPWGRAIYAVGVTADFRSRPSDCVEAHAGYAARLLAIGRYDTFTYLSSSRMYRGDDTSETAVIGIDVGDRDRIYDSSKLLGEGLTFALASEGARIARLSNIVPSEPSGPTFLADVVREARAHGRVTLRSGLESSKDYITLEDAIEGILRLASSGRPSICNVASGRNVSNATIAELLREHLGAEVSVEEGAPMRAAAPIRIDVLRKVMNVEPADPVHAIVRLMKG